MKAILLSLISFFFYSASFGQDKTVFVEISSGTWCIWCPRGDVYSKELALQYPGRYVLVSIHDDDIMELEGYFENTGLLGVPNGQLDRSVQSELWLEDLNDEIESQLSVSAPAEVVVDYEWDQESRLLEATINILMGETLTGEYAIFGVITEDGVTGPSPDYDQANMYATWDMGPMGGYEDLPNPVPAELMVYNHVARHLPAGYGGSSDDLPTTLESGNQYTYSFTYNVPESYNENNIKVIGALLNQTTGESVNAGGSEYIGNGSTNATPFFLESEIELVIEEYTEFETSLICHDTDYDELTIEAINPPSWVNVEMVDSQSGFISGQTESAGSFDFTLTVTDGLASDQINVNITVVASSEGWIQVGDPGFSVYGSPGNVVTEIDPNNGDIYAMLVNQNELGYVFKFTNGEWIQLGAPVPSVQSNFDFEINPATSIPWIIVGIPGESISKTYRLVGDDWTQIGLDIPGNSFTPQLGFTSDGTAHLVNFAEEPIAAIYKYTLEDEQWVNDGPFIQSGAELFPRMEISYDDEIYLMFMSPSSFEGHAEVHKYDDGEWIQIGEEITSTDFVTINSNTKLQLAVTNNNFIYAAVSYPEKLSIYEWDGANWSIIADNISNGVIQNFDIEADASGNLYVIYENENSSLTCERWNENSWEYMGLPNFTPEIGWLDLELFPDELPGVLYTDLNQNLRPSFKRYSNTLSLADDYKSHNFNTFPNPSSDIITIEATRPISSYRISDLTGRLVNSQKLTYPSSKFNVDLSNLGPGIYLIHFLDHSEIIGFSRVVKN